MISAGYLPVLVMVFSSIAIPLCILEVHILHILHLVTAIILKIIIYGSDLVSEANTRKEG